MSVKGFKLSNGNVEQYDYNYLANKPSSSDGLTEDIKQSLLACFSKVAWIDSHGQDYYDALEEALYPSGTRILTSISAVYTQAGTVYNLSSLDVLKANLVVTGHYNDGSTLTITTYTLSGTLTVGTSTITVTYMDKTTTFNVTVTNILRTLTFFKGCNTLVRSSKMWTGGYDTSRACAYLTESINGAVQYEVDSADPGGIAELFTDTAFAFPIQPNCTKVTVACPDLCCAINVHRCSDNFVYAVDNGHWSNVGGETNYDLSTFIANGATHLSIGFKNSSNTSIMETTIDSTTVTISFS